MVDVEKIDHFAHAIRSISGFANDPDIGRKQADWWPGRIHQNGNQGQQAAIGLW